MLCDLSEQELLQYLQTLTRFVLLKKLRTFFPQNRYFSKVTSPEGFHTAASFLVSLRKAAGHASWYMPHTAARTTTSVDTQP